MTMKQANPLQAGAPAPEFTYRTPAGEERSTAALRGAPYLVYFYPKDDTPGCTKEACAFRDLFADYSAAGVTIIGVSADSEKSHGKFREKFALPFPLASDPDSRVVDAFGAFGEKKFMGKTYEGIHRMSFLVGPEGKIVKSYPKVKPEEHAAEVLADVRAIFRQG